MSNRLSKGLAPFSILLLALFLSSCCTFYDRQPAAVGQSQTISWKTRLTQLAEYQNWSAGGAISIRYYEKTTIASFFWLQNEDSYYINLAGPLNFMRISIKGDQEQVALWRSAEDKTVAKNPETLLYKRSGWSLPISNLIYWIKGMPAPGTAYKLQLDRFNHASQIVQQGWTIQYDNFREVLGMDLPTKIDLMNSRIKVRIAIKNWKTN